MVTLPPAHPEVGVDVISQPVEGIVAPPPPTPPEVCVDVISQPVEGIVVTPPPLRLPLKLVWT